MTLTKSEIRKTVTRELKKLSPQQKCDWDKLIVSQVLVDIRTRETTQVILLYASMPGEIDTRAIFDDLSQQGKTLAYPKVESDGSLSLYQVKDFERDMQAGAYGINEPVQGRCRLVAIEQLDLILVPGLVFDKSLNRLGRGKGFYDRLLSFVEPKTVKLAACYNLQLYDEIPAEPHDIHMHALVTESAKFFNLGL